MPGQSEPLCLTTTCPRLDSSSFSITDVTFVYERVK